MSNLEIFKNKKIAIVGYGKEGKSAANFLRKFSSQITILDRGSKKKVPKVFRKVLGKNYLKELNQFEILILSPGISPFKEEFKNFSGKILTPTQIFFENFRGKIIGISGTKGKGTVAKILFQLLKKKIKRIALAGNIGLPLIELLDLKPKPRIVIAELSSFQLFNLKASPQIAILLDIFKDHLNWHPSKRDYFEAKLNLIRFQNSEAFAFIDKALLRKRPQIKNLGQGKKIFFEVPKNFLEKFQPKIFSPFYLKNFFVAKEVARLFKIKKEVIKETIRSFSPGAHHLEKIALIKKVLWINDSASTNPISVVCALKNFPQRKILIIGGKDKGFDLRSLRRALSCEKNLKAIIIFGSISKKLFSILKEKPKKHLVSSLKEAVEKASEIAGEGEVVLFSPGFASFDAFKNYKERGQAFKKLVKRLKA